MDVGPIARGREFRVRADARGMCERLMLRCVLFHTDCLVIPKCKYVVSTLDEAR